MKRRAARIGMLTLVVIALCSIAGTLRLVGARSSADDQRVQGLEPSIGQPAPSFSLPTVNGRMVTLLSLRGQDVPIAFFCGCDRCHKVAAQIARLQKSGQLRNLVSVISLGKEDAKTFQSQTHLGGALLIDPSEHTANLYNSSTCPRLWEISPSGIIAYRSTSGLEGRALHDALSMITSQ